MFWVGNQRGAYAKYRVRGDFNVSVIRFDFVVVQCDVEVFFFFGVDVFNYALFDEVFPGPFACSNLFYVFKCEFRDAFFNDD